MGDLIEKGKKFVSGIVKTVKWVIDKVKFFMTQVRNGRGSDYLGYCCNYYTGCVNKNYRKFISKVVRS